MRLSLGVALGLTCLFASSCATSVNACDSATDVCVDLTVKGSGSVDTLVVTATGAVTGQKTSQLGHAASLPVTLGLHFGGQPEGIVKLAVIGQLDGGAIGNGATSVTLPSERHAVVLLTAGELTDAATGADLSLVDHATSSDLVANGDLAKLVDQAGPPDLSGDLAPTDIATGPENCFDGVDNDKDGMMDCGDPDCTAMTTCTPTPDVGNGWNGPYVMYDGSPASALSCPGPYPDLVRDLNQNPSGAALTCRSCQCNVPSAVDTGCCLGSFDRFSGSNCDGASLGSGAPTPTGSAVCGADPFNGATTARFSYRACDKGDGSKPALCALTQDTLEQNRPIVTFGKLGRLCSAPPMGGGCAANFICKPKVPPTGYVATLCYYHLGDPIACPGGMTKRGVYFSTADDQRHCDPCKCGTLNGSTLSCNLTVSGCTNACCTPAAGSALDSGGASGNWCANVSSFHDLNWTATTPSTLTGGTCAATTGGTSAGTVGPPTDQNKLYTVCCAN